MREWIKNLRSTEKGRTVFRLFLYMLFFIFVLVLVFVSGAARTPVVPNDPESSSLVDSTAITEELSYLDKQKKFENNDYDFEYEITGSMTREYAGSKESEIIEGYRLTEDEIIKYSIEDGIVYKKTVGSKIVMEDLYKDLDATLFDFESLFSKLNATKSRIEKIEDEKIYYYEETDVGRVVVYTDEKEIEKIEIDQDSIKYTMTFEFDD